jgi:hypothetical protein
MLCVQPYGLIYMKPLCSLKSAISIRGMPCAFEKISLLGFCAALFLRGADI